jgi:hypothetical protein
MEQIHMYLVDHGNNVIVCVAEKVLKLKACINFISSTFHHLDITNRSAHVM